MKLIIIHFVEMWIFLMMELKYLKNMQILLKAMLDQINFNQVIKLF